jgi:hypothetical protein
MGRDQRLYKLTKVVLQASFDLRRPGTSAEAFATEVLNIAEAVLAELKRREAKVTDG